MKKIFALAILLLASGLCMADENPVFGLWEQLVVGDVESGNNLVRHNIIFTDKKVAGNTTFSALADSGTKATVICCLKISDGSPITLDTLLSKYKWDKDFSDHLRQIKGWSYIYEAELVPTSSQNPRMREIIKDMSAPGDATPFSAAVVSAEFPGAGFIDKKFSVGTKKVSFTTNSVKSSNTMQYDFSVDGKQVKFVEEMFPD